MTFEGQPRKWLPLFARSEPFADWAKIARTLEHAVKLTVVALDYDGTIASGDTLDPSVRETVGDARTRGITVLLVTERILGELRRVARDLHFVEGAGS